MYASMNRGLGRDVSVRAECPQPDRRHIYAAADRKGRVAVATDASIEVNGGELVSIISAG